jgi:hypothetical protein
VKQSRRQAAEAVLKRWRSSVKALKFILGGLFVLAGIAAFPGKNTMSPNGVSLTVWQHARIALVPDWCS